MKVLVISRGSLELARAHLARPVATIGRSPSCDVVLRAPGVAPVHFMLEWVGSGVFDSSIGEWSIFDISQSADDDTGEGVMLGREPVIFRDFKFAWVQDELAAQPEIGGEIRSELKHNLTASGIGGKFVELVQIRHDTGAVEELLHLRKPKVFDNVRPIESVREFRLRWNPESSGAQFAEVLLAEMPGARVFKRGAPFEGDGGKFLIKGPDLLEVRWGVYRFFIRLVDFVEPPKIRRTQRDPLLRSISLIMLLIGFLFGGGMYLVHKFKKPEEIVPPPRVATVEVKELAPPPPPAPSLPIEEPKVEPKPLPPEPKPKPKEELKAEPKPEPVKKAALPIKSADKKEGGAVAARQKPAAGPPRTGLNAPAPAADVNTIGILGALKKMDSGSKGPGVRPDTVINEGIITQAVSGTEGRVLLKNPPAGILGSGKQGGGKSSSGDSLAAAGTTLRGATFDPKSVGPIAREGGRSDFSVGTGLGKGSGVRSGLDFGKLDTGNFEVSGGLDKETIRRVIQSYKGHIRICYEKALLSSPKLGGRVSYIWNISASGPVVSVQIKSSDVGSSVLEGCVMQVIKGMQFPSAPNGRPTTVIYPFMFQSK